MTLDLTSHPMAIIKITSIGLLIVLSACMSMDEHMIRGCPRIRFVSEAAQIVHLLPGKNDLDSVTSIVTLDDFQGGCNYQKETLLYVDIDLIFIANQGPSFTNDPVTSSYFVAIITPDDQILTAQQFNTTIALVPDQPQTRSQERIVLTIPVDEQSYGRDYRVVIGFNLTPEQLAWNNNSITRAHSSPIDVIVP